LRSINLILAAVWLTLAAAIFSATAAGANPEWFTIRFGGTKASVAWLALALAGFNLVRWWLGRRYRAAQRIAREAERRREYAQQVRAASPPEPPNPDFQFKDESPKPE
jgi:hypothetical protein